MDITPLTSENQQGTDHHGWDQTQWVCGWMSEAHRKPNRGRESDIERGRVCVYVNVKPPRSSLDIFGSHLNFLE